MLEDKVFSSSSVFCSLSCHAWNAPDPHSRLDSRRSRSGLGFQWTVNLCGHHIHIEVLFSILFPCSTSSCK